MNASSGTAAVPGGVGTCAAPGLYGLRGLRKRPPPVPVLVFKTRSLHPSSPFPLRKLSVLATPCPSYLSPPRWGRLWSCAAREESSARERGKERERGERGERSSAVPDQS